MADKNLVPLRSIMVVRDGKRVSPPIGKAFKFTAEEVKVLKEGADYRTAVNEDEEADLADIKPERNSPHLGPKTNARGADNGTNGSGEGIEGDAKPAAKPAKGAAKADDDL